jgi:hypothetical protein
MPVPALKGYIEVLRLPRKYFRNETENGFQFYRNSIFTLRTTINVHNYTMWCDNGNW